MKIDFYFDPSCPWCWITSRWIAEVALRRDLDIRWRTFSLARWNHDPDHPPSDRARRIVDWAAAAMRTAEAVRLAVGESAVGDFYTEVGYRFHDQAERFPDLATALGAASIPESLVDRGPDGPLDAVVERSMDDLVALAGHDVGVPAIVYDGERAFFGPVMTPAPTGQDALELWDALVTIAGVPGFYELKGPRTAGPEFRPRP